MTDTIRFTLDGQQVEAERGISAGLGADCSLPVAALAGWSSDGTLLELKALLATPKLLSGGAVRQLLIELHFVPQGAEVKPGGEHRQGQPPPLVGGPTTAAEVFEYNTRYKSILQQLQSLTQLVEQQEAHNGGVQCGRALQSNGKIVFGRH